MSIEEIAAFIYAYSRLSLVLMRTSSKSTEMNLQPPALGTRWSVQPDLSYLPSTFYDVWHHHIRTALTIDPHHKQYSYYNPHNFPHFYFLQQKLKYYEFELIIKKKPDINEENSYQSSLNWTVLTVLFTILIRLRIWLVLQWVMLFYLRLRTSFLSA